MNKIYAGAQRFLSDYFGFERKRISIHGVKTDKQGDITRIQFDVRGELSDAPLSFLAAYRREDDDWELIRLPMK